MKTFYACFLGVLCALPSIARADEAQICADAYKQSQILKNDHKLLSARDQLRICSRSDCPAFITKDCIGWLSQVESSIPSVVLGMKDAAGADVIDVKVSFDGTVIATKLEGRAIDVDAGSHTFTFETSDGARVTQTMVVKEGVKNQQVNVVRGTATPPVPTQNPAENPTNQPPPVPPPDTKGSGSSVLKPIGYASAGLGIVGLGLGTVFGLIAINQNNTANCHSDGFCDQPQSRKDAQGSATISTVGFVAGGILAAGGLALIILAPSNKSPAKSGISVQAAPLVGVGEGGLSLRGAW